MAIQEMSNAGTGGESESHISSISNEDVFLSPNDIFLTTLGQKIYKVLFLINAKSKDQNSSPTQLEIINFDIESALREIREIKGDKVQFSVMGTQFMTLVEKRSSEIDKRYGEILPNRNKQK
jgi:hypothetical protein